MGKNTATTRLRLGQCQYSQPKWTDMRGFEKIPRESEQVQLDEAWWHMGVRPARHIREKKDRKSRMYLKPGSLSGNC